MVQVDQLLKKNFWIVILPLVAIAALLNAQAVTQLVGISLGPDEKALATPPPVAKIAPNSGAAARNVSAEAILNRNPFDHVTGSLKPPPVSDEASGGPTGPVDTSDPWNAPKCDGVKVLIIAASGDPEWSFAAFGSGGDGKSVMRRRGGDVSGKQVHFVGWDRVWLESGGSLCQATLFDKAEVKAPAPPPAPVASGPSPAGSKSLDPAIAKGIQKVSANEYNIDRGVVDKILENQADLMRQARIVPEQENGRVVGIRLFGVKQDTLLGVLGMENGDRLQTINGFDMSSPEKALEAYARLRTAEKLTISLNRKGQNMNIDYNIK
ncbi:MAG TPA: type II secretion system protein GspC [Labilithrix sp.]|nr:type II secretion system protein GspC [Labilithrix sp.]